MFRGGRLLNSRPSVSSRQTTRARWRATIDQGVAVVLALAAMFVIDAVETVMFATDDERGKIEGPAQGRANRVC